MMKDLKVFLSFQSKDSTGSVQKMGTLKLVEVQAGKESPETSTYSNSKMTRKAKFSDSRFKIRTLSDLSVSDRSFKIQTQRHLRMVRVL